MPSFVREAKGRRDQEAKENKHHPGQWRFPKAYSVTTSGINFIFKREKKTDKKKRDFKTVGVTGEDALCGNGKAFVHKYSIC